MQIAIGALAIAVVGPSSATAVSPETLRDSLEAAELSFAASVAEKDLESFAGHIADNAIFAAEAVLNGKAAIVEAWSGFFTVDAPKMEWHPETVVVQSDGRLGISKGPYKLTAIAEDGSEIVSEGQFISIWERQEDGGWKIIFDSGCPPCPKCDVE